VSNKKVLIVTYYWPPSGGSGVQRWLKFVKYLPQFGWKPYVFTPLNPSFDNKDESLLRDVPPEAEVIHFPIWEPYQLFFRIARVFGKKDRTKSSEMVKANEKSTFGKISTWIRGNIIIPDPKIFWKKPAVKFLKKYIVENSIDIIVTTGPPHSIHLIGFDVKKNLPALRWVADFRDPWSGWGLLDSLMVSQRVRKIHQQLEFKVLSSADMVTTITPFYVRHFEELGKRKVELLTNGFDEDDFMNLSLTRPAKFTIRHIGIINEKCDPRPFVSALRDVINSHPDFAAAVQLEFIGDVNSDFRKFVVDIPELKAVTKFTPPVPHKSIIEIYGSSSVLLLVLTGYKDAEGYMPGKLFEYLATGLPVLAIGPTHGDAAALLSSSGAGEMVSELEPEKIKTFLLNAFDQWKEPSHFAAGVKIPTPYSRKSITEKLTALLRKLESTIHS
jgi:glycosyltransferase involved in cell wall biosynthesis